MKKSFGKIGIILLSVIVFPTLFFSAYEISSISNNEQVIDSIYSSQLSNIAFSMNQYSDDILNRWADDIASSKQLNCAKIDSVVNKVIGSNTVVHQIVIASDSLLRIIDTKDKNVSQGKFEDYFGSVDAFFTIKYDLEKLLNSGYRKILPVPLQIKNHSLLIFSLQLNDDSKIICGIIVNTKQFVAEYLGPKIQSMAQNKFRISVYENETDEVIYSSDIYDDSNEKVRLLEELWLLKPYKVGIQLKGDPIEKLVNKRTRINVILIVIIDFLLLIGAWFVYRNVKREIRFAQLKSDFVSNVSHELKTPLALINMYSETLEMGRISNDEKRQEYIKVINKEANRLSRMVSKILNFSKIENGKREYNMSLYGLNDIVEQVVSTYQHHFKNKGFEYTVEYNSEMPDTQLDYEAVIDAINNLIDNAIKYSAIIKKIKISTGLSAGKVFVEVCDSGIGIEPADQKLIFDKFYRVTKKNLAHQAKGSGIGLNIVKHIMDAHNGEVQLESALGEGSCFKLVFPIK